MTHPRRPPVPRKRLVSVRLDTADVERVRRIAERMHARESDVFRFALSLVISRLGPLADSGARGADLLPLFLDYGPEVIRYFNLDTPRLAGIINDGLNGDGHVDLDDVELLSMRAVSSNYLHARLRALAGTANDQDPVAQLRQYLYRKYFGEPMTAMSPVSVVPTTE